MFCGCQLSFIISGFIKLSKDKYESQSSLIFLILNLGSAQSVKLVFSLYLSCLCSTRSVSTTATQQVSSCPLRTVALSRLRSQLLTGDSPGELSSHPRHPRLWSYLLPDRSAPSAPTATTASRRSWTTSNQSSARPAHHPNACRTAAWWSPPLSNPPPGISPVACRRPPATRPVPLSFKSGDRLNWIAKASK